MKLHKVMSAMFYYSFYDEVLDDRKYLATCVGVQLPTEMHPILLKAELNTASVIDHNIT